LKIGKISPGSPSARPDVVVKGENISNLSPELPGRLSYGLPKIRRDNMKRASISIILGSVCAPTSAQPYEITSHTIDNGGGTLTSANYTISGTVGQPDASQPLTSANYELIGGFWKSAGAAGRLCADQNQDGLVTPADFSSWIANYNTQSFIADVNSDGFVTPADFSAWIAAYNQGQSGPICNP